MRMTSFNNFSFGRLNSVKGPKTPEKTEEEKGNTQGSTSEDKPTAPAAPAKPIRVQRMIPLDDVLAIRASWVKPEVLKPDVAEAPETSEEPTVPTEPEKPAETTGTPVVTTGNKVDMAAVKTSVEEFLNRLDLGNLTKVPPALVDDIVRTISYNVDQLNENGVENILNMLGASSCTVADLWFMHTTKNTETGESGLAKDLRDCIDIYNQHNVDGQNHHEGVVFGDVSSQFSPSYAMQTASRLIKEYNSEIPDSNVALIVDCMKIFGNNLSPKDTKDLMAKLNESFDLKGGLSYRDVREKINDYVTHIDEHRANNPEYDDKPFEPARTDLAANALRDVIAGYNQGLLDKLNNRDGEIDAIKSIIEDAIRNGDATFGG